MERSDTGSYALILPAQQKTKFFFDDMMQLLSIALAIHRPA